MVLETILNLWKGYGGFPKYLSTNNFSGNCNETIDREIAMDTTAN